MYINKFDEALSNASMPLKSMHLKMKNTTDTPKILIDATNCIISHSAFELFRNEYSQSKQYKTELMNSVHCEVKRIDSNTQKSRKFLNHDSKCDCSTYVSLMIQCCHKYV
jgi:hypothetical protein